jgi:hypothetical protein
MTIAEIRDLIRIQIEDPVPAVKDHSVAVRNMLVDPARIQVIARDVTKDGVRDELLDAWLVGQEESGDGYRIVFCEQQRVFGIALRGFQSDQHLVLVGWYGDLFSAFVSM